MSRPLLLGILFVLFVSVIVMAFIALILRKDVIECETTQSPYCLQYICPDNKPATRMGENGEERST